MLPFELCVIIKTRRTSQWTGARNSDSHKILRGLRARHLNRSIASLTNVHGTN